MSIKKATNHERKTALFALHNALVTFYSIPACDDTKREVGIAAEKALNAHAIETSVTDYVSFGVNFLVDHAAQCMREQIKGKEKEGYTSVMKVMSPTTIKKAILIQQEKREMTSVMLDMPEKPEKKEKEKKVLTMEERIAREEYAAAKRIAKVKYDYTHLGDQNIQTKVVEKFTFPTFEEWAAKLSA